MVDKAIENKSLDNSLSDIKNSLNALKKEVRPVTERKTDLFAQDEKNEKDKNKKEVLKLEEEINNVTSAYDVEKTIEKEERKLGKSWEGKVALKKETRYANYFTEIDTWLKTSDRLAKKEIASSAQTLLNDLVTEDPSWLANNVRKVANWFLS